MRDGSKVHPIARCCGTPCSAWQTEGHDTHLLAYDVGPKGAHLRSWEDAAGWLNVLAYADDLLLYELRAGCPRCGPSVRQDNLCLWRRPSGYAVKLGSTNVQPVANMEFLGALLCGDSSALTGMAWRTFFAINSRCALARSTSAFAFRSSACIRFLRSALMPTTLPLARGHHKPWRMPHPLCVDRSQFFGTLISSNR